MRSLFDSIMEGTELPSTNAANAGKKFCLHARFYGNVPRTLGFATSALLHALLLGRSKGHSGARRTSLPEKSSHEPGVRDGLIFPVTGSFHRGIVPGLKLWSVTAKKYWEHARELQEKQQRPQKVYLWRAGARLPNSTELVQLSSPTYALQPCKTIPLTVYNHLLVWWQLERSLQVPLDDFLKHRDDDLEAFLDSLEKPRLNASSREAMEPDGTNPRSDSEQNPLKGLAKMLNDA
ncbi:hypothetical protein K488DRAFT_90717 [Vararia minispora EC-137]|uniref:Uncharacterized protein n=1 Tax=Vararia minispora EC-137 TaxID=1314806 RepID=A0ACB8Q6Z9_9AGAM|nr:hypothetical protein K488DRAFT_90717 [Vararia minispora EC-137]